MSMRKTKEALDLRQTLLDVVLKGKPVTPGTMKRVQKEGVTLKIKKDPKLS
jgi:hypothetical protein